MVETVPINELQAGDIIIVSGYFSHEVCVVTVKEINGKVVIPIEIGEAPLKQTEFVRIGCVNNLPLLSVHNRDVQFRQLPPLE